MKNKISWTIKLGDGVKREVRVTLGGNQPKWQYKYSNEDSWDYDTPPTNEDWDALEDILARRAGRGRAVSMLEKVKKMRATDA